MDLSRPRAGGLLSASSARATSSSRTTRRTGRTAEDRLRRALEVNPKLIMCRCRPSALNGPYSRFRAFGANMEAVVGHALLRGYTDTDPTITNTGVFLADACGGDRAPSGSWRRCTPQPDRRGASSSTCRRRRTFAHAQPGRHGLLDERPRAVDAGQPRPLARAAGRLPLSGEDAWIALSCGSDEEFAGLCGAMDRPELTTDERFADRSAATATRTRSTPKYEWSATQHNYTAFHRLQEHGVPAARCSRPPTFRRPALKSVACGRS